MADENKKGKNKGEEATLEMTPMIDVVFQLLIFFIVTLNQPDILSQFDALPRRSRSRAFPRVRGWAPTFLATTRTGAR